jgi:hypothetical protein
MSVAAQDAIRAWVNARPDLVGDGMPLSRGAYLREQKSPADGGYTVIQRGSEGTTDVVAEDSTSLGVARMQCLCYAGTETAAEQAAKALRQAFEGLNGSPELCGATGVYVMVAFNHLGPIAIPHIGTTGEQFCFQVNADFLLRD